MEDKKMENQEVKEIAERIIEGYRSSKKVLSNEMFHDQLLTVVNSCLAGAQATEEAINAIPPDIVKVRNESFQFLVDNPEVYRDEIDKNSLLADEEMFQSHALPAITESITKLGDIIDIYNRVKSKLADL
jgi:hypothetical protein